MSDEYSKPFQTSMPHDTCYLDFNQTFEKSIGYSEQVHFNNPSLMKHQQYLKDMLIYNALNHAHNISSIPEQIQSNNSSCNEFLHVSETNKPQFTPSKWEKPNKTDTNFKKANQETINEITFGKPRSVKEKSEKERYEKEKQEQKEKGPLFPDLKILENHSGEIEESVRNESTATTESRKTEMQDSFRKEEEWNKAQDAINNLKKLIG